MYRFLLFISFFLSCSILQAQPVFKSGEMLPVGSSGPVYSAGATIDPGTGSEFAQWDFSMLNAGQVGDYVVMLPDTTRFYNDFPSANYVVKFNTGTLPIYYYYKIDNNSWEMLSSNYTGSSGDNYAPNAQTRMIFPFKYQNTYTDTFQNITNSPRTIEFTYDGFGTLKTAYGTYANVARIRYYYGPNDFEIFWMSTGYVFPIMIYSSTYNSYTIMGGTITGIEKPVGNKTQVTAYPNPFQDKFTIRIGQQGNLGKKTVVVTDIMGRIVATKEVEPQAEEITIPRNNLSSGMYLYRISNEKGVLATGVISAE